MDRNKAKREAIKVSHLRVRKCVKGDAERPRLSVYRSEKHIYGQIIDDERGVTLVSASSIGKDLRDAVKGLSPLVVATKVGERIAEKALAAGITKVAFDRGGRRYGGRVAAVADGARSKGLQF